VVAVCHREDVREEDLEVRMDLEVPPAPLGVCSSSADGGGVDAEGGPIPEEKMAMMAAVMAHLRQKSAAVLAPCRLLAP